MLFTAPPTLINYYINSEHHNNYYCLLPALKGDLKLIINNIEFERNNTECLILLWSLHWIKNTTDKSQFFYNTYWLFIKRWQLAHHLPDSLITRANLARRVWRVLAKVLGKCQRVWRVLAKLFGKCQRVCTRQSTHERTW
jgi:hypothetical protein